MTLSTLPPPWGRGYYFLTELHGFLDHLRENLEILDEQILNAREMSKKEDATALQWAKTLRDLVDLRNVTLEKIQAFLLGRSEVGTVEEPMDVFSSDTHPLTCFERKMHDYLAKPWTVEALKTKCEKCGTESETTVTHQFDKYYTDNNYRKYIQYDNQDLCDGCYDSTLKQFYSEIKAAREKNGWTLS
jgi:hypothetical protein